MLVIRMKKMVFLTICALAFPALADVVMPEPLHRIGYEALMYAAGAAAALGGGLLAGNRRRKVWEDTGFTSEWKDEDALTEEERKDIEAKLESGLPFIKDIFDRRFEEVLPRWLDEDKKLPKQYTLSYRVWRARMSVWKTKNETLLKELLASDETLVQRLIGIPLEFLRDRLMKSMPTDFTAGWFAEDSCQEIREKQEPEELKAQERFAREIFALRRRRNRALAYYCLVSIAILAVIICLLIWH